MFDITNAPEPIKADAAVAPGLAMALKNQAESDAAELYILDQIGEDWMSDGITAQDVVAFLNSNQDRDIRVVINSPGGSVYDGLTMYNALKSHAGEVRVEIVGQAYSAASFVAMAGDHIAIHQAADIGIHQAHVVYAGNANGMRAIASYLETIDEHLVDIYEARTGQARDVIASQMEGEDKGVLGTLMSATEAKELGYVDEIIENKKKKKQYASVDQTAKTAKKRIAATHAIELAKLRSKKRLTN